LIANGRRMWNSKRTKVLRNRQRMRKGRKAVYYLPYTPKMHRRGEKKRTSCKAKKEEDGKARGTRGFLHHCMVPKYEILGVKKVAGGPDDVGKDCSEPKRWDLLGQKKGQKGNAGEGKISKGAGSAPTNKNEFGKKPRALLGWETRREKDPPIWWVTGKSLSSIWGDICRLPPKNVKQSPKIWLWTTEKGAQRKGVSCMG